MLKKILIIFVFSLCSVFVNTSHKVFEFVADFMKVNMSIQNFALFRSAEEREFFLKLSCFYSEKLKSLGVEASPEKLFTILNNLKVDGEARGYNLENLIVLWNDNMQQDRLGFKKSGLFLVLQKLCIDFDLQKVDTRTLSPEKVFKHELEKHLQVSMGEFREDFFAYAWNKLEQQYEPAEFLKILNHESEQLKGFGLGLTQREYPCFAHLMKIYSVLYQLCCVAEGEDVLQGEMFTLLKVVEQKNVRLAKSELYNSSIFPLELLATHPDVSLFVEAITAEVTESKNQKFKALKAFVARRLDCQDDVVKKGALIQLKNKLRHELNKHRPAVNEMFFEAACKILFDMHAQNDQVMDSMLKRDIKTHQRVVLAVKEVREKHTEELKKQLIEEGLIDEIVTESGVAELHMSMKGAPFFNSMLMIYDNLQFLLKSLQKRKIVNNEESLLFIVDFLKEKNPVFTNFSSQQANTVAMNALLINIMGFCPVNTYACFDQIRKEHVAKIEERKNLEIVERQAKEAALVKQAEEKALMRRLEKEKKRQEKELLQQQQAVSIEKDESVATGRVESDEDFYKSNGMYLETMTQVREQRKLLPKVEDVEFVINDSMMSKQDDENAFLNKQKVLTRDAKAERRAHKKSFSGSFLSEFLRHKYDLYQSDLCGFVSESKHLVQAYEEQQRQAELERLAFEQRDDVCADDYNRQNLKKIILNKWRLMFNQKLQQRNLQEESRRQEQERVQNQRGQHTPYSARFLGLQHQTDDQAGQEVPVVRRHDPYGWKAIAD